MYSYVPQNEDELELKEGDLVSVMEKCDDGWFVGTCFKLPPRVPQVQSHWLWRINPYRVSAEWQQAAKRGSSGMRAIFSVSQPFI